VALIFPAMLSDLTDLGISEALIRFAASSKREKYIATGLFFKLLVGAFSSLLIYFYAEPIASRILLRPYLEPLLRILSVYTVSNAVLGGINSALIGLGRYGINAILLVVQNTLRVFVTVALLVFGNGLYGAIFGFSVSYATTSALAFVLLWRYSGFSPTKAKVAAFKPMISYSLPLYTSLLLSLPLNQYSNLLLAWFVTNEEIGNYSIAANLLTPLALIGGSLSTAMFSAFSRSLSHDKANATLNRTMLYTTVVMAPISLALIVFCQPITHIIYGEGYALAPQYLALLALTGLYSVLGFRAIDSYFRSVGATRQNLQVSLVGTAVTALLAFPMVMLMGISGNIGSSLIGGLAASLYARHLLKTKHSMHLDVVQAAKALIPPLAAAIVSGSVMLPLSTLWVKTAIGAIVYLLTLALTIPIAIDRKDIRNFKELASDLTFVGGISEKAFSLELKLAALIQGG